MQEVLTRYCIICYFCRGDGSLFHTLNLDNSSDVQKAYFITDDTDFLLIIMIQNRNQIAQKGK